MPEGGIGLVYCNVPGEVEADRQRVKELLMDREGVADVLEPARFHEYGLPHPRAYAQAPDLVIVAKDGYAVSGLAEGEAFVVPQKDARVSLGSHGFLSTSPKMNAVCVLAGRGVRAGANIDTAENISIAPTAAKLLGIEFQTDGQPLTELLVE